jgi:hypothetical protein
LVRNDKDEEEGYDGGLVDEHEDLTRVLSYYEEKSGQKVGIMPAVVDTDDIEMDLIVGIDSDEVLGIRMFQFFEVDKDEELEEDAAETGDEPETEEEGDENEEIGNEEFDVLITDLSKGGTEPVKGKLMFTAEVPAPTICDDNGDEDEASKEEAAEEEDGTTEKDIKYWINVSVYYVESEDDGVPEFTGAVLFYVDAPDKKISFLPNAELE